MVDIIVDLDLAAVQRQLKAAFPDAHIEISARTNFFDERNHPPRILKPRAVPGGGATPGKSWAKSRMA